MKKIIKRVFLAIISIVIGIFVCMFGYTFFKTKEFNEDGLTFDHTQELDAYKNKIYYSQLSKENKKIYESLYHASINLNDSFVIEWKDDIGKYDVALNAFTMDWPEFFYWLSLSNKEEPLFNSTIIHSKSTYTYLGSMKEDYQQLNDKVDDILNHVIAGNDYETIKNIHDFLIDNITYDNKTYEEVSSRSIEHSLHNDILAALIENKTLCNGYASAFQMLVSRAGYNCSLVAGRCNNNPHSWNFIEINNNWYQVDVTFDEMILEDNTEIGPSYEYFLASDDVMNINHIKDNDFIYPICSDEKFYYYNMPGKIVRNANKDDIEKIIIEMLNNNQNEIYLKFIDIDEGKGIYKWLFEEDKYFETILINNYNKAYQVNYQYSYNNDSNLLYFSIK